MRLMTPSRCWLPLLVGLFNFDCFILINGLHLGAILATVVILLCKLCRKSHPKTIETHEIDPVQGTVVYAKLLRLL